MKRQIEDAGEIEYDKRGKGTPLVFLHAFPFSNVMWRAQSDLFAKEFKVIAPNVRGVGETSPFSSAPSVEQMAHDLALLLDDMNLAQPIILCGLSMGGYAALAFARMYPQRLNALVLCDTQAAPDSPEAQEKRQANIEFARSHTPAEFLERMLPSLLGETTQTTRPALVEKIRLLMLETPVTSAAIVQLLEALRDRPDATPYLDEIKAPTLVMVGYEDTITPPQSGHLLAHYIPKAEIHLIPQAGHLTNLERPQEFNRRLLSFVRSI